jgi:competence protein ComGC
MCRRVLLEVAVDKKVELVEEHGHPASVNLVEGQVIHQDHALSAEATEILARLCSKGASSVTPE